MVGVRVRTHADYVCPDPDNAISPVPSRPSLVSVLPVWVLLLVCLLVVECRRDVFDDFRRAVVVGNLGATGRYDADP